MSGIRACNTCGYFNGIHNGQRYECPCFLPCGAGQRRYLRLLKNLQKERERRNYDPENFDSPESAT